MPYRLLKAILSDRDQQRRSWYWFFLNMRFAETAVASFDDYAFLDRLWRQWSPGYACPPAKRAAISRMMFAAPDALTHVLG